ncbi:MAG TPA: amidase [Chloroflexota bacterium]|nr:amidase [Chloroflexota bacterium]
MVLGGLGTDTGGSIRGPSAYCGITGIKPTFGRVSKEGCVPLGYSLDNIGPMTRTVRDCAMMLQIMAGYDPADPCTEPVAVPDMTAEMDGSLANVRIGVPGEYFFTVPELDGEVKAAVLTALDQMKAAGATLVDVKIPHAAEARVAQRVTMLSEAYAYHEPTLQRCPELYGKYTRQTIQQGAFFSAADYVQAQRVRALIKAECAEILAHVDVVVVPTMLNVAPTFAGYNPDAMFCTPTFTGIWNLVGLPALSVCCGFSDASLPVAMQIIGKPFAEPIVFKVGDAYQQITDWHTRVPRFAKEVQPV